MQCSIDWYLYYTDCWEEHGENMLWNDFSLLFFPMFLSAFAFINLSTDRFQPHTCACLRTMWLIWCLWAALRLQWYYFQNGLNRSQLLTTLMIFTLHHTYAVLLNIPLIFPAIFLKGMCGVLAASLLLVQLTRLKIVCVFWLLIWVPVFCLETYLSVWDLGIQ